MILLLILFSLVGLFGFLCGYNRGYRAHYNTHMDPQWFDDYWDVYDEHNDCDDVYPEEKD